jgi:hypothetical protein
MSNKLKVAAAVTVSALALIAAFPSNVIANKCCACCVDAAYVNTQVFALFQPFMDQVLRVTGLSIENTVAQSGSAVRAEIMKASTAEIMNAIGLEDYRAEQAFKVKSVELQEAMKQPVTTCRAVSSAGHIGAANTKTQTNALTSQRDLMTKVASNTNSGQFLERAHQTTNQKFCTPEDKAQGICDINKSAEYKNLAGADRDASFLFQGADGSASYVGKDSQSAQAQAADGFIARVVGALPPEHLRGGSELYESSQAARVYVELVRRYNSMVSVSAYALQQIKAYHTPQAGLGTATKMDTVSVAGFTKGKADMSEAEVMERFVATKFSPESVTDLSGATEPHLILRDMAQMDAFKLRMSYQTMQQSSRMEGIAAHQLILLAEKALRPQIDAQRASATQSIAKAGSK